MRSHGLTAMSRSATADLKIDATVEVVYRHFDGCIFVESSFDERLDLGAPDRSEGTVFEARQHVEAQMRLDLHLGRGPVHARRLPFARVLAEAFLAAGRVDVGAAREVTADRVEPLLGVALRCKAAGSLAAVRRAVAGTPGGLAAPVALLDVGHGCSDDTTEPSGSGVAIALLVEPAVDVLEPVPHVPSDADAGRPVAPTPPAVDRRERDPEPRRQLVGPEEPPVDVVALTDSVRGHGLHPFVAFEMRIVRSITPGITPGNTPGITPGRSFVSSRSLTSIQQLSLSRDERIARGDRMTTLMTHAQRRQYTFVRHDKHVCASPGSVDYSRNHSRMGAASSALRNLQVCLSSFRGLVTGWSCGFGWVGVGVLGLVS